ncbi:class II aldolase/adducin family protein [Stackebrandtia nassauensis]|uniref:Class II aldolase/adducin family protein n=1 Tax=Stackebrandtia nassauensis (strain DSM 44728 / CIP 108903 / NRRL B-16338 / NBRC 102104 / LLR-40K-21) TaxID=446470 RepID=D3Q0W9_STANL|nr:class II aldolase/adducin family protein [Stackebrandtia nassauensis]ADD43719.1 class II aldolase/adducin family protein [Stackebrandtia nassauensis DSM 44728]
MTTYTVADLTELSLTLGQANRDLVILAEGNTSVRLGPGRMLVKASGSTMPTASESDFVELETAPLLELISSESSSDDEIDAVLRAARIDPAGPRPSMEALLHAICLEEAGATVVAHTHPIAVNAILCSDRAETLVAGSLFPDQIVVMGRHNLLVPYADPGLALARSVRDGLRQHRARHGAPPKVVYLVNHGIFVLADSPTQALAITDMTVKSARILLGALSAGEPRYLSDADAERIDVRPDEVRRRERLAAVGK